MVAAIARAYPGVQDAVLRSRLVPHFGALTGAVTVTGNAGNYSVDQIATGVTGSVSVTGVAPALETGPYLHAVTGTVTVTGIAPPYSSGLQAYEVRALSGGYAPSVGETTMWDAVPTAWQTGDPVGNPKRVITAWSGGIYDQSTGMLWIHGGGHADSAFNGWIAYDVRDDGGVPAGFSLLGASLSDLADVPVTVANHETYSDGLPGSIHSYDGMAIIAAGVAFRVGGSLYRSGNFSAKAWSVNLSTGASTELAAPPAPKRWSVVYDSTANKVLGVYHNEAVYAFYDVSGNAWSSAKFFANSSLVAPNDGLLIRDTTRGTLLAIGGTRSAMYSVDWGAETVTQLGDITWTGDTTIVGLDGLSGFYDSADDAFWIFGGNNVSGSGAAGYVSVARIDAADLVTPASVAVAETSLTGDTMGIDATTQGSWKRFAWMPDTRQIVFVSRAESPAYVIQLPDAA